MCDMLSVVISLKSQMSQTSGQNKYWGEVGVYAKIYAVVYHKYRPGDSCWRWS